MNNTQNLRDAVVRERLIAYVADRPTRRTRAAMAIALVLAGALGGAGVSAGAFAASGSISPAQPSGQPEPALPAAVPAPPGVEPGEPIISLLGEPVSVLVTAPGELDLSDRPSAATHARVTITPTAAGLITFGTTADRNNPSASWGPNDALGEVGSALYDFPIDSSVTTLYLDPVGFEGIATVQYVTYVPTLLGENGGGQSFGVDGSEGEPDLTKVVGTAPDGSQVDGYVRATDLDAFSPDHPQQPSTPEEVEVWQAERDRAYPNGWDIPVYDVDGTTVIGTFHIG